MQRLNLSLNKVASPAVLKKGLNTHAKLLVALCADLFFLYTSCYPDMFGGCFLPAVWMEVCADFGPPKDLLQCTVSWKLRRCTGEGHRFGATGLRPLVNPRTGTRGWLPRSERSSNFGGRFEVNR